MDREQQREAARKFAASRQAPTKVEVKAWGGDVFVRPSSWSALSAIRREHPDDDDTRMQARIVAASLCDANGALTFDPENEDDLALLLDQGQGFINAVATAMTGDPGKDSAQTTSS